MVGRRRLTKPTLGVYLATSDATSIPAGTIIEIPIAPVEGVRTVDVIWNGEKLMMFVNDLESHSHEIGLEAEAKDSEFLRGTR